MSDKAKPKKYKRLVVFGIVDPRLESGSFHATKRKAEIEARWSYGPDYKKDCRITKLIESK